MKIIQHGPHIVSIVDEIGGSTKLDKQGEVVIKRLPARTRILVQVGKGYVNIIRGSLMLSTAEVRKLLTGII